MPKYLIPFRSFVSPKSTWDELFKQLRAGQEVLVSSTVTGEDSIEIITRDVRLVQKNGQ